MECIAPHEITEEQLLAYADGEGNSQTSDHIRRCRYCAERVRALTGDQMTLRALLHRAECPDPHTLGEFHLGLLAADEQTTIEEHLKDCPDCAEEIDELEHFLQEVTKPSPVPTTESPLRRMVAQLASPPSGLISRQPALALRGAAAAPPDVYQAEDVRVVVGLEADGVHAGRKMLLGFTTRVDQPLESLSGAYVQLNRRGEMVALEQIDTLGNFVFCDLRSGEYELVVFTGQEQIVIESIVV
ncbi:MAG: hypothetical protein Kow0063_04910 [Anaerolineae bacterium]